MAGLIKQEGDAGVWLQAVEKITGKTEKKHFSVLPDNDLLVLDWCVNQIRGLQILITGAKFFPVTLINFNGRSHVILELPLFDDRGIGKYGPVAFDF